MHPNERLLTGNIPAALASAAVPLLLGDILQQFYNTIDAFIIGRYMGNEAFAAVGVDSTVMNLFVFILVGFCSGISVIFANAYGAGDTRTFRQEVYLTVLPGGAVVVGFSLLAFAFTTPILRLLQTPDGVLSYAQSYLRIITLGLPTTYFYNLGAALLRGIGRFQSAVVFLSVSVALNLVGDYLLVAVVPLGIAGAAYATVFAQLVSAVLCFVYVKKNCRELLFTREDCTINKALVRKTMEFGSAAAMHQSSLYLGKMLIQGIVDSIGLYAITAFTAATRIEGFVNAFGSSICQSCSVFTAQNVGVGAQDRVKRGLRAGMLLALAVNAVTAGGMFFFAAPLIRVLLASPTAEEIAAGVAYLKIVAVFYALCFIGNVFVGYYRGIGQAFLPFLGTTLHISVRVLVSWMLADRLGLSAVGIATGIGWTVVVVFHTSAYFVLQRRQGKEASHPAPHAI